LALMKLDLIHKGTHDNMVLDALSEWEEFWMPSNVHHLNSYG
jgi:hypothetical protein